MGHSLRPDNLTITPDFVIADGTHNSGYVLVSATGGIASWKNTDNLPGFKSGHYIGELWGGGVVAGVWKENDVEKCLIVSLCDYFYTEYYPIQDEYWLITQFLWSNISATGNATSSYDGLVNSTYINQQAPGATRSGAYVCLNYTNPDYGTGTFSNWYLPSVTEMQQVVNNAFKINYALSNYSIDSSKTTNIITKYQPQNGNVLSFVTNINYYWTSTEVMNSGGLNAYAINALNNTVFARSKSNYGTVRPVRIASETTILTDFSHAFLMSGGNYTIQQLTSKISGGGDAIVEIGSCWNGPYNSSYSGPDKIAIPLPTINDNKIIATMIYDPNIGFGYGNFQPNFSAVTFNVSNRYSIRSYAITSSGVVKYGEQFVL